MIIPTSHTLLQSWRAFVSRDFGPRPKVPYVKEFEWRNLTMFDDCKSIVQMLHRREISGKSPEWRTANEIWDGMFETKTHYKSHKDLNWDYLLVYIRDRQILATCMIEIRCVDADQRRLYHPFGVYAAYWPRSYTPAVYVKGLAVADVRLKNQGIGRTCMKAVCDFAEKLLAERATSPWANAFGRDVSRIPVVLTVDMGDDNAAGFYRSIGFHTTDEDDKRAFWYPSWSLASEGWLPRVLHETQMCKWIYVQ
jgi:GNAT superfamily N-acetyltransferase